MSGQCAGMAHAGSGRQWQCEIGAAAQQRMAACMLQEECGAVQWLPELPAMEAKEPILALCSRSSQMAEASQEQQHYPCVLQMLCGLLKSLICRKSSCICPILELWRYSSCLCSKWSPGAASAEQHAYALLHEGQLPLPSCTSDSVMHRPLDSFIVCGALPRW